MKTLLFVEIFFQTLEKNNIRYVHWKSNLNLHNALLGDDDLDILVHPEDQEKLENIFKDLDIIRGYSEKDVWQKNIYHYYGVDEETSQIIHIHLHYALPVGYDYNKNFTLPITNEVLETREKLYNVYISSPEYEYVILIIRILIKNSLTPFLLSSPKTQIKLFKGVKIVSGYTLDEFLYLKEKVNREKLNKILNNNLPEIGYDFFETCENTIIRNNSLLTFLKTAYKLKRKLKQYQDKTELNSFLLSFYRINKNRVLKIKNKIFPGKIKGTKLPENGGRIFAFIGGDGAGKSTNISKLKKNLSKTFKTASIHIGKPPKSFAGRLLYYASRILNILGLKEIASNLMYLRLAIDRKRAFVKAEKLRKKGVVVILDRIPTDNITAMDSPRINKSKYPRLARFERNKYKAIRGVDSLFVMKLNPEIALKRRPEDNPDMLRIRSGQVWENSWDFEYQIVTDTGELNFEQVERRILINAWQSLVKPYKKVELIGISGVGKSTLTAILDNKFGNVKFLFSLKDYPGLALQTAFRFPKGLYSILRPNRSNLKSRLKYRIYYQQLILNKIISRNQFTHSNYFLDQSIIFHLALGLKEGCITKEYFLKNINKTVPFFDFVVYLYAPKEVLFKRVKNRENQGIGRAKDMTYEKFEVFYEEYEKAFAVLEETDLKLLKIDTSEYSPEEILDIIENHIE
ncbi:MAG: deoxynucleoside kinase [Bacteroidetes bacterium]|jgi:thymidylate kinase|nr:deoxynucleoside kinase [Bacteroidota bacterium]